MKKFKLLPTVLMLVLCVGVLAVGVFAITPTKNTISGTITINASNEEVEITGYIDGVQKLDPTPSRAGVPWNVSELKFNLDNANNYWEVEDIIINLHIKNKSEKELGAYFYDGSQPDVVGQLTDASKVLTEKPYEVGENTFVKAYFCSYSHMMPYDDESGTNTEYDEIDMKICLSLERMITEADLEEGQTGLSFGLDIDLNIEEYIPNVECTIGNMTSDQKSLDFIRLSSHIGEEKRTIITDPDDEDGEYYIGKSAGIVVVPNHTTQIGKYSICNVLAGSFNIPKSVVGTDLPNSKGVFLNKNVAELYIPESFNGPGSKYFIADSECLNYSSDSQGVLYNKNKTTLVFANNNIKQITQSVTSIGEYALYYCNISDKLVIPEGVTTLMSGCFSCLNVSELFLPSTLTTVACFENDDGSYSFGGPLAHLVMGFDTCYVSAIKYNGTMEQFKDIHCYEALLHDYDREEGNQIICTDGVVTLAN